MLHGEEDSVIDTVGRRRGGCRQCGGTLSCWRYQVKTHTTGCRHGDTMVTTRCSTRMEHDLAYVKVLPVCVCVLLLHYFRPYLSHSKFKVVLRHYLSPGFISVKTEAEDGFISAPHSAGHLLTFCKFMLHDRYFIRAVRHSSRRLLMGLFVDALPGCVCLHMMYTFEPSSCST